MLNKYSDSYSDSDSIYLHVNFIPINDLSLFHPKSFIKSNIIPLPKGSKVDMTDSANYRSIAIGSIISKILDNIIMQSQSVVLQTSDYQFGFKPKSSTMLCTSMITKNDRIL